MIKIKLMRSIKRKDLVKEYETKYKTQENLKKLCDEDPNNVELDLDLDEWGYSLEHGDEILEQTRILYRPKFSANDFEILKIVKNEHPESITEIAKLTNKDVSFVQRNIAKLNKDGLIDLKEGQINNMKTPVFNYDKIEIAI